MQQSLKAYVDNIQLINTEMEKRNQELQKANEQAIIAKKKKTAFLQDMMHQIRTPLNIIGGFAQVLNENYHELPADETSNIIHMMQDNTRKFVRISRMLVAASASDDEKALQNESAAYDEEFVSFMETYGGVDPTTATAGDYLRAMTNETGKVGADGYRVTLLDEFVAGTDPTDPDDVLYATIAIEDGTVYVGWVPDLNADGKARRVYKVWGKREIQDGSWSAEPLSAEEIDGGEYRFFKVTVEMP